MTDQEREFQWDDEIEKDGGAFVLLPVGEYNFTVSKFERGRFQGSEKMPACNMAKLEIDIHSEFGEVTIFHNLMLHSKTEGFLSNFFTGIGQKKKGEKLRMNWSAVFGAKGRCKVVHNKYVSKGEERVNNQIETFLPYEEYLANSNQGGYQQPAHQQQQPQHSQNQGKQQNQGYQQNYQQQPQQNQQPFPTQGQQQGGYTPGQF